MTTNETLQPGTIVRVFNAIFLTWSERYAVLRDEGETVVLRTNDTGAEYRVSRQTIRIEED